MPDSRDNAPSAAAGFWRDDALIFGIKFGAAGVLAVFLALLVRLQEPTWALFTVYVLMIAQYVGAVAEKSLFRLIGTVIGGVLGYILTASLQQTPWLFLPVVGVIIAFSTAMFGQSRYPYAFLLCGLTTVVVTSNGLQDPDNSWYYMLWRTEEVGLGILVAMLVQCLFWPRYARVEFIQNITRACGDLRDSFAAAAGGLFGGGAGDTAARALEFPSRISALRGLLDYGGRESQLFRDRLATYFELTTCLSRIASAIGTLTDALPADSLYRSALREELPRLHSAIEGTLDDLAQSSSSPERRSVRREEVAKAFAAVEERLENLRNDPRLGDVPPGHAVLIGLHMLALDDIRRQIVRSHELLDSLPLEHDPRRRDIESFASPTPPAFWIRSGIKSGIAVVLALVLENWANVPGGPLFVLGAWVFTALNATSPSGHGDRRAFDYVVFNAMAMIALTLILLLTSPMLSSYAVMNTVIFVWLFLWGYRAYAIRGVTIPMQVAMLGSVGVLGLNGQQPVTFQAIADFTLGILLAQVLAAVVQRVLWPSLPQWELRDRFAEFLRTSRQIVEEGAESLPLWQKSRIALIPGEAAQRIGLLTFSVCPPGERERLTDYLHALQKLGSRLVVTAGRLAPLLPDPHRQRGQELIESLEKQITTRLAAHEQGMSRSVEISPDDSGLNETLSAWRAWVAEMRAWTLAQRYPMLDTLRLLGFSGRYERAGEELLEADRLAARLRLPLYMGDYVL